MGDTQQQQTPTKPAYPPEWRGTWFRPGEPGGVPSPEAKQGAWAVIIRAVDDQVRGEATIDRQEEPPVEDIVDAA